MKKKASKMIFVLLVIFLLTSLNQFSYAATFTGSSEPQTVGSFYISTNFSGLGDTMGLLSFKAQGGTTTSSGSQTFGVGALQAWLSGHGISSTNSLVMSLNVNEIGSTGTDSIYADELTLKIDNTSYSLAGNNLQVYNFNSGASIEELLIKVNLDNDFMKLPSSSQFIISSSMSDVSDGKEIFSLTSIATPVPIPAAAWMLGSGLIALVTLRRRTK